MADLDLARRLAAHPRWRWAAGMRAVRYGRIIAARADGHGVYDGPGWDGDTIATGLPADAVPDLDDPATAGWLLAMLPVGWCMESPAADGRGGYAIVVDGWTETARASRLGPTAALAVLACWGEP